MKRTLLILLISLMAVLAATAQDTSHLKPCTGNISFPTPSNKSQLIADETQLTYLKTGAKITTTLESVFQDISLKFGTEFKKVTITYKHANGQSYKEYVILISEQTANNIAQWAKKNL